MRGGGRVPPRVLDFSLSEPIWGNGSGAEDTGQVKEQGRGGIEQACQENEGCPRPPIFRAGGRPPLWSSPRALPPRGPRSPRRGSYSTPPPMPRDGMKCVRGSQEPIGPSLPLSKFYYEPYQQIPGKYLVLVHLWKHLNILQVQPSVDGRVGGGGGGEGKHDDRVGGGRIPPPTSEGQGVR